MYLASVVLTQSSVQRQFLKQIKHSLRLGGCCPFFLLLLLHQLWRPYSCRRIGSETCSHWKLTLKEDLCLRASTCIKKGTEIGGWRRVEFGTDFSQHCTVKQAQTGCEIAEQMGSVKWYFSKAPSNFQLFFFFFPRWPTLQQLHKQLHQHTQGRAELWYKDLLPQSNCGDSELFNLNCCHRKFS